MPEIPYGFTKEHTSTPRRVIIATSLAIDIVICHTTQSKKLPR
jgi:hypothetical protein